MHFDVVAGVQSWYTSNGVPPPDFLIEVVGNGGNYATLQQKAHQFLFNPEIRIIIALLDSYAVKQIEPFINAAGKALISIDPGAHTSGLNIPSPFQVSLSLQSAYASALTVNLATQKEKKKIMYVTSFFDGGYTHCYSSSRQWEKANAQLLLNYVFPFAANEFQESELCNFVKEHKPDALIVQMCAEGGGVFLDKCAEAGFPDDIPIYASPFMLERDFVNQHGFYFKSVSGYFPWVDTIDTEENKSFCKAIASVSVKSANVFHLLGWETGMIVNAICNRLNEAPAQVPQLLNEITAHPFVSPRGPLTWMATQRQWVAPMYECKLTNVNGKYQPQATGNVFLNGEHWNEFASDIPEGVTSRWYNMYLCPT